MTIAGIQTRNLLAVSWEMPPMRGPRATQVARLLGALTPLGWRSTVVCMNPRRGGPHWPDGVDAVLPDGVEAVRVASAEESTVLRVARRLLPALRGTPDPQSVWIGPAAAAASAAVKAKPPDGLVTFAQPWSDHLVGLRLHRETKLPWVAHFSDPWVDSPYFRTGGRRRAAATRLEADVIREATTVVFVTDETADLVMKKYPVEWRDKAAVVPHGFEPAANVPVTPRTPGPLRMVYTGRFYDRLRTPRTLFQALAQLNARQPLAGALELTCVGPHVVQFAGEAASLDLSGIVHLREAVPQDEARAVAAQADVLLVIDAPTTEPSPFLPSKLVDYLPLHKLILGITPATGATARLLKRLGCPAVAPDDVKGIETAIEEVLGRWRQGGVTVERQFERVASEFDIRRTAAQFNGVLTRAFDAGRA